MIRSSRQFVLELGYSPQSWSKVIRDERDVPVELIRKAIERFDFNPQYLFSGEGDPLQSPEKQSGPVLTIAVDENNEERIIHVPVSAQAGYMDQFNDPVYMKDLPSFSLPGFAFKHATYRAFDISGDSMEPTVYSGEIVVCSYVDPDLWLSNVRSDYVYVIVTTGDIVIKRVRNTLRSHGTLLLRSDNSFYGDYEIAGEDIREIWFVKMKISPFAHAKVTSQVNLEDKFDDMRAVISSQSATIQNLNQTVEKLLKKDRIQQR
jgi:phage repressor protein C with HTH and peptisase S24 domain